MAPREGRSARVAHTYWNANGRRDVRRVAHSVSVSDREPDSDGFEHSSPDRHCHTHSSSEPYRESFHQSHPLALGDSFCCWFAFFNPAVSYMDSHAVGDSDPAWHDLLVSDRNSAADSYGHA